jgi:predicted nucleotidyltransferase
MGKEKITKQYYESLINDYVDGKAKIKGDHPEEIVKAIDSFFHAGKILVDHPEVKHIPSEYIENLLKAFANHPQYYDLLYDLIGIVKDDN